MVAAAGMEEQEQGGITVEDNGYRNVLVAVSQNVSEEESGESIVNDIKEAMTALSQTMLRATQRRLYVAEVTILLPITWRNTQQYQEATTETYLNSKVRVLPPNPIYGDQPFTVQPGGCGEPGLYLHLTPRYLGDGDVACRWGDKGKALMREWARLRWGVFEEHGYKSDPVFPAYYWHAAGVQDEPRLVPNHCTDEPVLGKFVKSNTSKECQMTKEDEECHFEPQYLQNATSSLMGNHHLSSVHSFCDSAERTHNNIAPTRHNLKCGQPVWDVMNLHRDFMGNSTVANEFPVAPRFTVVREVAAKYVVALETTPVVLGSTGRKMLTQVTAGLRHWLREEVANESYVGVVEFGIMDNLKKSLTRVGNSSRDALLATLDSQEQIPGKPCYICALRYAMQILGRNRNNSVILLVASGQEPYERAHSEDILEEIKINRIRLLCLVFSEDGPGSEHLREATSRTGGRMFNLTTGRESEVVEEYLREALRSQPRTPSAVRMLTFALDAGLDTDLNFTLTPVLLATVPYLVSPSGQRINTKLSSNSDHYSIRVANPETGLWFWEVGLLTYSRNVISVIITARTNNSVPLQVEAWANTRGGMRSLIRSHLILFARVRRHEAPVTNATVRALVSYGTPQATPQEVFLLDIGAGADGVAGDGIYSRHFTNFTKTGWYYVKIEVFGDNSTRYKKDSFQHPSLQDFRYSSFAGCPEPSAEDPATLCCGRAVPSNPEHEEKTGPFNRTVLLGSFWFESNEGTNFPLPPSRVEDLRVVKAYTSRLALVWTAPGGELDQGNVTSYQFLLTTHFSSMPDNPLLRLTYPKDNATNSTTLLRLPFGHPANFTLDLPTTLFEKRLYFLALRSKNKAGETSELSNVVRLVLVKKPAENDNKGNTTGGDGSEVEGGRGGGGPSLPLTSLSESGIGWDDVAYVCVLIFFLLTCMW
ncbi:calcium-activated chloride channel regulator 1-like isoform X2 [Eriocheir sinensis]|uniref:calcium-activated chloride channel regulator 1-like isoform X2 n=1 Tax=Eriocheir sinensis TaxID=95602 RepID=UPI0021C64C99|nr:calcium-activated chloride channel regulator 1-like isoform X2 [Eriocheir sinensis]